MRDDRNLAWSWAAGLGALAVHAANGAMTSALGAFPVSLDELQHLSFIRAMERAPQLLPRYEDLQVLTRDGAAFTTAPNYLNHPSPYYLLMGLADRAAGGSIPALRLVDLVLSLLAVAVLLIGGFQLLRFWRERAVFAAALVLFPKLGVVAGLINNDNAALLAVGCAFLALGRWQARASAGSAALLAASLALCGWTKLTVLLMIGFGAGFAELIRLAGGGRPRRLLHYGLLALGLVAGAIPSLANFAAYGRLLHHTDAFYVPAGRRVTLGFFDYVRVFLAAMVDKWSALEPSTVLQRAGVWAVIALAGLTLAAGLRDLRRHQTAGDVGEAAAWRVACGLILATAPVLLLHLYFGWRTFVEDGFVEMAQVRYYYGVWPGFALAFALLWRRYERSRWRFPVTAATGVLLASASIGFLGLVELVAGRGRLS